MASVIQYCLGGYTNLVKKPNKPSLFQSCVHAKNYSNLGYSINVVNYSRHSIPKFAKLSVTAGKKLPLHAKKRTSSKNQWRVWCSSEFDAKESSQTTLEYFIRTFFHAININDKQHIEGSLSKDCVFEDIILHFPQGRPGIVDFITKAKEALGSHIRLVVDEIKVKEDNGNNWKAYVSWHLGSVYVPDESLREASSLFIKDDELPTLPLPLRNLSNTIECGKSDGKLMIRKISGGLHPEEAYDFGLELLRTARDHFENPQGWPDLPEDGRGGGR